jgi:hypothetical protein
VFGLGPGWAGGVCPGASPAREAFGGILYPAGRTLGIGCVGGPCFNTSLGVVALDGGRFSSEWFTRGGFAPLTAAEPLYGASNDALYFDAKDFPTSTTVLAIAWGGFGTNPQNVQGFVSHAAGYFTAMLDTVAM